MLHTGAELVHFFHMCRWYHVNGSDREPQHRRWIRSVTKNCFEVLLLEAINVVNFLRTSLLQLKRAHPKPHTGKKRAGSRDCIQCAYAKKDFSTVLKRLRGSTTFHIFFSLPQTAPPFLPWIWLQKRHVNSKQQRAKICRSGQQSLTALFMDTMMAWANSVSVLWCSRVTRLMHFHCKQQTLSR